MNYFFQKLLVPPVILFITAVFSAVAYAAESQKEVSLGLPQQIGNFYAWALGIGGLVALGVLVFGGILYTVSAGNSSRQDDAKQWITGSIVGLIILFGSWFILNTINPELTKLTDLKLLANKAAEGLPGNEGTPSGGALTSYPTIIDGQTCPVDISKSPSYSKDSFCENRTSFRDAEFKPFCQKECGLDPCHGGTDITVPFRTQLYAIEDGVIGRNFGSQSKGGNRLHVIGKSGTDYYYAHLDSFAPGIDKDVPVKAGQLVGFADHTGTSFDHLHLEVKLKDGTILNPFSLLERVCKGQPGELQENPALAQVLNKSEYSGSGVVFQEIGGMQSASINPSQLFPSASLYKLFVAEWFYDQREKGILNFNQKVPLVSIAANIRENDADGVGFLQTPSDPVSISECLPRMIKYSDNICGWALRDYALKNEIDTYLSSASYTNTSVGSLKTSADDVTKLLTAVAQGKMVSQPASESLYSLMLQQYEGNRKKIPAGKPSGAEVANKTGELHGSNYSHDAAILKYNGKTYILVVLTHLDPDIPSTNQAIQQLTSELFNALK